MKIPKTIVDRDREGVEKLTYYGVPVTELDRDELLAALNQTERKARMCSESFRSNLEFQALVRDRERADYFLSGGMIGRR